MDMSHILVILFQNIQFINIIYILKNTHKFMNMHIYVNQHKNKNVKILLILIIHNL